MFLILAISVFIAFLELSGFSLRPGNRTEEALSYPGARKKSSRPFPPGGFPAPGRGSAGARPASQSYNASAVLSISGKLTGVG
jgi:hypothetical protein